MSVIADALIIVHLGDRDAVDQVNHSLRMVDGARRQQFVQLPVDSAGGSKYLCTDIYAIAANHLVPSDIEDAVAGADWRHPDEVIFVLNAYDYDLPMVARTITQLREDIR